MRKLAVLAVAGVALLLPPPPASAEVVPPDTLHVVATFGAPVGSRLPFSGRFTTTGSRVESGNMDGWAGKLEYGGETTVMRFDGDKRNDFDGRCVFRVSDGRDRCRVGSPRRPGHGTIVTFDPKEGGQVVFDVELRPRRCPRCTR